MATESLLRATLALYHDGSSIGSVVVGGDGRQQTAERVFGSTASLLSLLTNPLNISLLTSHFLTAPTVWGSSPSPGPVHGLGDIMPSELAAANVCFRVISVYNTAAIHVRRHELEDAAAVRHGLISRLRHYAGAAAAAVGGPEQRPTSEAWAQAVAQGADSRSPRWRHLLVLVGVLLGLEGGGRQSLSRGRRAALEQGVVAAANLALGEAAAAATTTTTTTITTTTTNAESLVATYAVVLGLTYAFPLLSEHARAGLHCDELLPAAVAQLSGPYGFQGGRILEAIEADLPHTVATGGSHLHWPPTSASFRQLQQLDGQQPLVASAGPLATLAAYAAANASPGAVLRALDGLLLFSQALAHSWARCGRLASIEATTEVAFLSPETAQVTWPLLWQHLRKALYAVVVVLQAVVGRSLLDRALAGNNLVAPRLAAGVLEVLQNLFFISSRQGAGTFQAYQFAYLAAIDLLARYPDAAAAFLGQLLSASPPVEGTLSPDAASPKRLTADLFYLNVAEHFAAVLPPAACEQLLIQPALPYVSPAMAMAAATATAGPLPPVFSPAAREVFEAAHSAMLSALSCPHNAPIAASLSPFYAEALFASFPGRISARQFRLAFKTLIQILSPPFPVYATHPDLAETLLEMVRIRATSGGASTAPLRPAPGDQQYQQYQQDGKDGEDDDGATPVSEQSALVLTLIDALPFLALPVLQDWMTTTAAALWTIGGDPVLRQAAQHRFWEVLGSGEMDVERAALCVAWWGNGGGCELVLQGPRGGGEHHRQQHMLAVGEQPMMSGALQDGLTEAKL